MKKKKNNNSNNNIKKEKSSKYEILKFISASLITPIVIGIVTAYITFKFDKPKEYVVRETFNMNNFKVTEYFPLHVGDYWTYDRNIKFNNDYDETIEMKDKVKKEIIEEYDNGDMQLFVIKGDPTFLDRERQNIDANEIKYGYILISHKVIEVSKEKIDEIINKFKQKEDLYYDDLEGLTILFEFPLFDKQKYGEYDQLFRNDERNVYYVSELQPYKKKIGESIIDVGIYYIDSLYNDGDASMSFTPYLGITEYSYNHNGTIAKYLIELDEYKIKE